MQNGSHEDNSSPLAAKPKRQAKNQSSSNNNNKNDSNNNLDSNNNSEVIMLSTCSCKLRHLMDACQCPRQLLIVLAEGEKERKDKNLAQFPRGTVNRF